MKFDYVPVFQHVILLDLLALEPRRAPDAGVFKFRRKVFVDALRQLNHGAPGTNGERKGIVRLLSGRLGVDSDDPRNIEDCPFEVFQVFFPVDGDGDNRERRPPFPLQRFAVFIGTGEVFFVGDDKGPLVKSGPPSTSRPVTWMFQRPTCSTISAA